MKFAPQLEGDFSAYALYISAMRIKLLFFIFMIALTACASPTQIPPATESIPTIIATIPPTQNNIPTIDHIDTPPPTPISPPIDLLVTVQKYESVSDGYILYGSYQWASPNDINVVFLDDVIIRDANGTVIQYDYANPAGVVEAGNKSLPFAFKVIGTNYVFPLSISVESITVILPDTANFQFDAGANPQVGDEWIASIDVPISAYHVFVHKIKLISGSTPTELGFNFTIWVGPNINIVSLDITDINANNISYGGGGGESTPGEIDHGWAFEGYSPAGLKTFQISNLNIKIYGEWQTTWQP